MSALLFTTGSPKGYGGQECATNVDAVLEYLERDAELHSGRWAKTGR